MLGSSARAMLRAIASSRFELRSAIRRRPPKLAGNFLALIQSSGADARRLNLAICPACPALTGVEIITNLWAAKFL
jgi:hypothetical protein